MTAAVPVLHPADQTAADRHARSIRRCQGRRSATAYRCDHGEAPGYCRTCLELRHAEQNSVTVRASYAFGDWPPGASR